MKLIKIGKIVNTHGIRGELRIISNFEYKNIVFKPDIPVYIDKNPYQIKTYRPHKQYDMITLKGFDNINQVLIFKGKDIYVDAALLAEYTLADDLIGYQVFEEDKLLGVVGAIVNNSKQQLLKVMVDHKHFYVPKVDAFIKNIDHQSQIIYLNHWEGLL